jgi:predicted nucleotidyltransferase
MDTNEQLIREIVDRILGITNPRKIILFGSAAVGMMTSESDLLVIEDDFTSPRKESIRLRKALSGLGLPVDIFAMTSERFDETKDVIGGLAYPAHRYGKVIYEAS